MTEINEHNALCTLWTKIMEIPTTCKCGKPATWKDYPGSEHSCTFGGPWKWTPVFYCDDHKSIIGGRVGGPI